MEHRSLARPGVIIALLILQIIPLLLFPPSVYSPSNQEWWLPALLAVMVLWADVELIVRRRGLAWPWYLIAFAQGFNIISRLMLVWSHSAVQVGKNWQFNTSYVTLSLVAMVLSGLLLWYAEQPDVRSGLLPQ